MTSRSSTTKSERTVSADAARQLYMGLEPRILELESWGSVLLSLGTGSDGIDPRGIAVIGQTLALAVEYLKADFQDACAVEAEAGR